MSKWRKPSEELFELLETLLEPFDYTKRKMFGSQSYFVNGNMFAGVFEETIFVRLKEEDREQIFQEEDDVYHFEPHEGRKMREYIILTDSIYREMPKVEQWVERAYNYADSLPPKQKKK
ncbi:MAG: TfoX/Sxy family protein [Candidatus Heimdallarchaeota archaeon]